MVSSDWGDWLPTAVADATPSTVAVWYLGCNGAIIKGCEGTTVLIDPYLGTGDPPRTVRMIPVPFAPTDIETADGLLATHEHSDHVHEATQAPLLASTDATMYGPDASIAVTESEDWTAHSGVTADQFQRVTPGETISVGEFSITVTPAHDPDATDPVGYLIEHASGTFFHGGDARPGTAFEQVGAEYDIDLGMLAFGSAGMIPDKQTREPTRTKWYNDENELIRAANQLRLDRLIPTHWDMWRGLTADPTALHSHTASFPYPDSLEIVSIGDRIDL